MAQEWTVQSISDWAVQAGLQPRLMATGNGVMLYQPGEHRAIFAIYFQQEGNYIIEVGFNPANKQSWLLRDLLQEQYDEIEISEDRHKWPRIGLVEYASELLEQIAAWAGEYITTPWTPKPVPVVVQDSEAVAIPETQAEASTVEPMPGIVEESDKGIKLSRWLTSFFSVRGIPRPDGRSLYAYKTTNVEFEKITKQLQLAVAFRGHRILQKDRSFSALFVLFAAEWWRREYRGGAWTWLPIYQSIGLQADAITRLQTSPQTLLYPALEKGFLFWKRQIYTIASGRTFIGSIAAEGGLPLNLLSDAHAGLNRYFRHVLDRFLPLRSTGVPASQVASELNSGLPVSFRREQVYRVVGDIVETTLELRTQYDLSNHDDPVAYLDSVCADWRERLPLSLDNEPSQALLSDLMVKVSKSAETGEAFSLIRDLSLDFDGAYRLNATIDIPKKLPVTSLASLFGELDWPSVLEIWLLRPFKTRLAVCSRTDEEHYRARSDGIRWHGLNALSDTVVGLSSYGRSIGEEQGLPGSLLEEELPWVFVENDNRLVFLGQGGMRLAAETVTVCVPEEALVNSDSEQLKRLGEIRDLNYAVYEGGGALRIRHEDGQFSVYTQQPKLEMTQYGLKGHRLFHVANIRQVFIGAPRLYRREINDPDHILPTSAVLWRPLASGASWRTWSGDMQGVVEIKAVDGQEVLFRTRVGVLPEHAEFRPSLGEDDHTGEVEVHGMPDVRLLVCHEGIDVVQNEQADGSIRLTVQRRDESLSAFPLEVQWPDMPKALQITLPIPVAGARFGAEDGHWLPDMAFVSVADLAGVHAMGFNHLGRSPERFNLDISIRARDFNSIDLRSLSDRLALPRNGSQSDLPLIQLREQFMQLFSLSEDLDCRIELTLEGNRVYRRLRVGRYSQQLSVSENTIALKSAQYRGHINQNDIDDLTLEVHSLLSPVERGYQLTPCASEGVRTGEWFKPQMLAPGPWLVMVGKSQNQAVRPTIFVQPGYQQKNDGRLRDAITLTNERERRDAISRCLQQMVGDYSHKDWRFVFETLDAFQHLPATTLDLWDCFACNANTMAMLLLAADETNYQGVIDLAKELPFIWELVPMSVWLSTLSALKQYIQDGAPEGIAKSLVEHAVKQKLGFMCDADPILERPAKLLATMLLGYEDEEILKAALFAIVPSLIEDVMGSASSDLLKRQAADAHWPVINSNYLTRIRESAPEFCSSLFTQQAAYMTSVLHAPVALAVRAATHDGFDQFVPTNTDLFALQQIRQFDDAWYQEAFGMTLIYLHAIGALECSNKRIDT